jgi:uncharacterized membrane protein YhaH (DUF805 family)
MAEWFIYLFTGLHGRISRVHFWIGLLSLLAVEFATRWIIDQTEANRLGAILGLALDYPEFALALKRANDRDLPAWWPASFFIIDGVLGIADLLGFDPMAPIAVVFQYLWIVCLAILIADLGFRRGTSGPNRNGPDPLAGGVQ